MKTLIVSPKDLCITIRQVRKKKGLTQSQLGSRVGLDQKKVSLVENGNGNSRLDTLFRLLSALEVGFLIHPKLEPTSTNEDSW